MQKEPMRRSGDVAVAALRLPQGKPPSMDVPFSVRIVRPGGSFEDRYFAFKLTEDQQQLFLGEALSGEDAERKARLLRIFKMQIAVKMNESLTPEQIIVYRPIKLEYVNDLTAPETMAVAEAMLCHDPLRADTSTYVG